MIRYFTISFLDLCSPLIQVFLYAFQIRSLDAVHKLFEGFPEAFMDTLHVPLPDRYFSF